MGTFYKWGGTSDPLFSGILYPITSAGVAGKKRQNDAGLWVLLSKYTLLYNYACSPADGRHGLVSTKV